MRQKPHITHERLLELVEYDPATGLFTHRIARNNATKVGAVTGCEHRGAVYLKLDYRKYPAAKLAWFFMNKQWPTRNVLHRDKVRDNNAFTNLYESTAS